MTSSFRVNQPFIVTKDFSVPQPNGTEKFYWKDKAGLYDESVRKFFDAKDEPDHRYIRQVTRNDGTPVVGSIWRNKNGFDYRINKILSGGYVECSLLGEGVLIDSRDIVHSNQFSVMTGAYVIRYYDLTVEVGQQWYIRTDGGDREGNYRVTSDIGMYEIDDGRTLHGECFLYKTSNADEKSYPDLQTMLLSLDKNTLITIIEDLYKKGKQ